MVTWLQYATLFIFMDQAVLLVHHSHPFQVTQLVKMCRLISQSLKKQEVSLEKTMVTLAK